MKTTTELLSLKLPKRISLFNRISLIIRILSLIAHTGCKKDKEENITTGITTGWQDGMKGKILYSRNFNDVSGVIYYISASGLHNVIINETIVTQLEVGLNTTSVDWH